MANDDGHFLPGKLGGAAPTAAAHFGGQASESAPQLASASPSTATAEPRAALPSVTAILGIASPNPPEPQDSPPPALAVPNPAPAANAASVPSPAAHIPSPMRNPVAASGTAAATHTPAPSPAVATQPQAPSSEPVVTSRPATASTSASHLAPWEQEIAAAERTRKVQQSASTPLAATRPPTPAAQAPSFTGASLAVGASSTAASFTASRPAARTTSQSGSPASVARMENVLVQGKRVIAGPGTRFGPECALCGASHAPFPHTAKLKHLANWYWGAVLALVIIIGSALEMAPAVGAVLLLLGPLWKRFFKKTLEPAATTERDLHVRFCEACDDVSDRKDAVKRRASIVALAYVVTMLLLIVANSAWESELAAAIFFPMLLLSLPLTLAYYIFAKRTAFPIQLHGSRDGRHVLTGFSPEFLKVRNYPGAHS